MNILCIFEIKSKTRMLVKADMRVDVCIYRWMCVGVCACMGVHVLV